MIWQYQLSWFWKEGRLRNALRGFWHLYKHWCGPHPVLWLVNFRYEANWRRCRADKFTFMSLLSCFYAFRMHKEQLSWRELAKHNYSCSRRRVSASSSAAHACSVPPPLVREDADSGGRRCYLWRYLTFMQTFGNCFGNTYKLLWSSRNNFIIMA